MPDPEQASSSRLLDMAWRAVFRIGFPLARLWWRLSRTEHEGALVAIHVGDSLLLLRSSYRTTWNFPGGTVRRGETPEAAARRELIEEIGFVTDAPLREVGVAHGRWDGRKDKVVFFAMKRDQLPALRLDNREIIGARLVPIDQLREMKLTSAVRAYVLGRVLPTGN